MIATLLRKLNNTPSGLDDSKLLDEGTFYTAFLKDLDKCGSELLIESPFVTCKRIATLLPLLKKLKSRRVKIAVFTRDPSEKDGGFSREDSYRALAQLQSLGVQVVFTAGHHRKIAVLDRKILYEGSLNILSQNQSREIMRRFESVRLAWQTIRFTELDKLIN